MMQVLRLPPIGAALALMLLVSAGAAAEGDNVTQGE
jgi:hypothetical protein